MGGLDSDFHGASIGCQLDCFDVSYVDAFVSQFGLPRFYSLGIQKGYLDQGSVVQERMDSQPSSDARSKRRHNPDEWYSRTMGSIGYRGGERRRR